MTVLQTDRLTLRRFTEADGDLLWDLDRDPAVMRFLNGGRPTPREVVREKVLPGILAEYGRWEAYGRWAAEERETGEFLGWFALRPVEEDPGSLELGYRLKRSAWGQGYGAEGARALVRLAFAQPGVERVVASTMTVNVASRRVMEKAGLRLVRTFFQDWPEVIEGSEAGDVEYALTRAEWQGAPGGRVL
ncbi:GNAT family acetyltransferase [Deinococcus aetherius]|uniref:GNAT family acetyltransferase n=1 Tax=Deinococcus aetherius TaxID=200252 RepID=A0ABN6RAE9_9DEIO|nr:GNAT family N-acetyltransferase [Deinococcus aetherius]BDP40325.1 GNAT family acetyltransferase [Deinococcus aetherius]